MRNTLLLSALALACLAGAAMAETKIVVLKDGTRLTGEVKQTAEGVEIKLKYGTVLYKQDQVAQILDAPKTAAPADSFEQRQARVDKSDPEALYDLAQWAVGRRLYRKAEPVLERVLKLKPDHKKAQLLLKLVQSKTSVVTPPPGTVKPPTISDQMKMLLSEEDVYRVRLAELQVKFDRGRAVGPDRAISVRFRNDVLQRFVEKMESSGKPDAKQRGFATRFLAMPASAKVAYILKELPQDAAIHADIQVRSDPAFMRVFRQRIWPAVSQSCGSLKCHGSPTEPGGKFKLFNIAGRNVEADYTNFVVLSGIKNKAGLRVIDRGEPEKSLLLEFALPPEQSKYKHAKEIKPVFRSRDVRGFQQTLEWIKSLRGPMHPNYHLQYKPPFGMVLHTRESVPDFPAEPTEPAKTGKDGKAPKDDKFPFE